MVKKIAALSILSLAFAVTNVVGAQTLNTTTGASTTMTQSTPGTTGTMTTNASAPGLPNTGTGADAAANAAILLLTGLVAVAGVGYLVRRKSV